MNKRHVVILASVSLLFGLVGVFAVWEAVSIFRTPRFQKLQADMADQRFRTAVALIELHRVQSGKYPDSLRQIRFVGMRGRETLSSVKYVPSADRTGYFVESSTGWGGNATAEMPEGFWKGLGYQPEPNPSTAQ